jgi:UDP-N-acetyl-D-galactosamine dehydrogenase
MALSEKIAVIGLGYVGLPVALAFAAKFPGTLGYDIDSGQIASLRDGADRTGEISAEELAAHRSGSLRTSAS